MHRSLLVITAVFLLAGTAHTESAGQCFTCKGDRGIEKVCQGASRAELIQKCGEPDSSETAEKVPGPGRIEYDYYNCGAGRFIKILKFDEGRLVSITNRERRSVGAERCW